MPETPTSNRRLYVGLTALALVTLVVFLVARLGGQAPAPRQGASDRADAENPSELVARSHGGAPTPELAAPAAPDERQPSAKAPESPESPESPASSEVDEAAVPLSVTAVCVDESGDPLAGVRLSAMSLAGSPVAFSDASGSVRLTLGREHERTGDPMPALGLPGAPLAFLFVLDGPSRRTRIVHGPPLETLEHHDCGRIVLGPVGRVTGRVVGADGEPVTDLAVHPARAVPELDAAQTRSLRVAGLSMLSARMGVAGAKTDLFGRFVIEGIPSTEGACVWVQGPDTYASWSAAFTVAPNEAVDVGTLTLEPFDADDRIEGRVTRADGEPAAGALVLARTASDSVLGPQSMRFADAAGRFVVPALLGEAHRISAHDPQQPELACRVDGVAGGARDVELRLGPAPAQAQRTLVRGRVVRAGQPVAGALVTPQRYRADDEAPEAGTPLRADAKGQFTFEPRAGQYVLVARDDDGESVGTSARIVAARSSEPIEVVVELVAAARIEGHVRVAAGTQANGIELLASGPEGLRHRATTRSDGTFELTHLVPGSWSVRRSSASLFTSGENVPEGARTFELELAPGETAHLEVDLAQSAQLDGRLAIGDQVYSSWFWSIRGSRGQLRADGTFHVSAITELGETKLAIGGRLGAWMVEMAADIALAPGANAWSLEVSTGSVELTGLALGPTLRLDGQLPLVCTLRFEHTSGAAWQATPVTAVDGRVRITNVPAGQIAVARRASLSVFGPIDDADLVATIEVRAGETTRFAWPE